MEMHPAIDIAFAQGTPLVENESVLKTFQVISYYIGSTVLPALSGFLPPRVASHGPTSGPLTATSQPDPRWLPPHLRPEDEIKPPKKGA